MMDKIVIGSSLSKTGSHACLFERDCVFSGTAIARRASRSLPSTFI